MNRAGILVACLAVALAGPGRAEPPAPTADSRYLAGLDKQHQGDLSANQADARQLYAEAITEYQAATRLQPDHYRANLCWAVCLAQLAVLDPNPDAAGQHLVTAHQRFAAAADCPGADHAVFEQWANLLLGNMLSLVQEPADRIVLLRETAAVCERGLASPLEPGPRAQLVQHLGRALRQWAELTTDPAERRDLLRQADDHLRTAGAAIAAHQRWQTGLANQNAADTAPTPDEARRLYRAAIAEYQTAAAAQPDHYESHLFWATCLTQLLSLTDDGADRQRLLLEADQRFAVASRCPRPNHVVFDQWTGLLLGNLDSFAPELTQRVVRVQQAIDLAERGLALATAPTPQAQLHLRLGDALCQLAACSAAPAEQRALLERAIEHLRAATAVVTVRHTLYRNGYLGIALLSLGRLLDDPARLRAAAAEFEATLQFAPNQWETHYNLAATRSLLGDPDQAGHHLATVIDHDPAGDYLRLAEQDPDLARVRGTPAYRAALDRRRRQTAEANALALLDRARQLQQQAQATNNSATAAALWTSVAALAEQASRATPDLFAAQSLGATALAELAQLTRDDPELHRQFIEAARRRFATAARCPGVDAPFYDVWSAFLLDRVLPRLGAPDDRAALLTEMRLILADGVARARFSGLRHRLASRLGCCLVLLARQQPPPPDATTLYRDALRHFETAAAASDAPAHDPQVDELWGWALLRTGQANRDKLQVRQGIDRFVQALQPQPDSSGAHYGLACAYAQLRQFDQSFRHLQHSLRHDPHGLFQRQAETDPDLRSLRQTAAYVAAFRSRPSLDAGPRPTISEK